MLTAYPACFFKECNGYSVIFPDLNYLATCGATLDESLAMAIDCLAGYLFEEAKDGEQIPDPSDQSTISLQDVAKELDFDVTAGSFVNLVAVDVEEYAKSHFNKAVKKTLTIPEWLNRSACEANLNFSQVLQEALIQKLGKKI